VKFRRSTIAALHDIIMAALSFILSLYLRLSDNIAVAYPTMLEGSMVMALIAGCVFYYLKLYRGIWRYASLRDLVTIIKAVTLIILIFIPSMFLLTRLEGMPRSVLLINWLVLLVLLGGPRFLYRIIKDRHMTFDLSTASAQARTIPIMLVGMNSNAELFLRQNAQERTSPYEVVAIVDNNKTRIGSHIYGVKIYGDIASIPLVVARLKRENKAPQKLILTADHMDKTLVRELLEVTDSLGLTLARLPKLTDFRDGITSTMDIKPVVLEDLLGRAQNALDRAAMQAMIAGKNILVTGCGGTIGSELVRQIASYNPSHITLIELCEYNLYMIDKELEENFPALPRTALIADIRSKESMETIFRDSQPSLVFHAAALKHVPLVEDNVEQAVLTNIIGTKNIADCCVAYSVAAMVMISTDKAVNPTNVMGATKRAAESYVQGLGSSKENKTTHFITVRFGNVLGSSGSVIPLFQRQLEKGGPLTVTHPDMERYFMTVREAVELVLQASVMGQDALVKSIIYVLDMGEPVRINDLALQMIRMAGLRPEIDIKIIYTGLRPGEKLYEELFYAAEAPSNTAHESIMLAMPSIMDFRMIRQWVEQIRSFSIAHDKEEVLELLMQMVPEYKHEHNDNKNEKKCYVK
jgi:FlaA1/EpsC-like NDP-sugar epimerase